MNLKKILKTIKLNESSISMFLGALVIIVLGVLLVNYFKDRVPKGLIPFQGNNQTESTPAPQVKTYEVQKGDSLWSISEKFYGSGYNWTDIAKANDISKANSINVGQVLSIPSTEPKVVAGVETPRPTEKGQTATTNTNPINGTSYTVVKGDNLWNIAVRAYGDGFKWTEIASANKLTHPNLIHPGNDLTLPR